MYWTATYGTPGGPRLSGREIRLCDADLSACPSYLHYPLHPWQKSRESGIKPSIKRKSPCDTKERISIVDDDLNRSIFGWRCIGCLAFICSAARHKLSRDFALCCRGLNHLFLREWEA